MILAVTQRPRARLDLLEQFVHFGEQHSIDLAERYFAAIDATCRQLADHPHSGPAHDSGIARLKGLRHSRESPSRGSHRDRPSGSSGLVLPEILLLTVAEFHQPTDCEQEEQKAAEAVSAVVQSLFIRFFGRDSHHHRREQREEKRGFKVREIDFRH
jgi:plasmid stabilization system protein ParE